MSQARETTTGKAADTSQALSLAEMIALPQSSDQESGIPFPKYSDASNKSFRTPKLFHFPESSNGSTQLEEGFECEIKTLYEGPPRCQCCINWVETFPDDLRGSIEKEVETKKKAVVARMRKNHDEGKPLVLDSIVVQSLRLKQLLGQVFQGYKGITTTLKSLVFRHPFHPFYYRWDLLKELVDSQTGDNSIGAQHSRLFYKLIHGEMEDMIQDINDLIGNGVITFEYLWALFESGVRVFSSQSGHDRFFVLRKFSYEVENGKEKSLELDVQFVDYDGTRYGLQRAMITIEQFTGTKPIMELEAYPSKYCPNLIELESKALARGTKMWELRGVSYMAYSGLALWKDKQRRLQFRNVRALLEFPKREIFSSADMYFRLMVALWWTLPLTSTLIPETIYR
jgi:hypothetical protein